MNGACTKNREKLIEDFIAKTSRERGHIANYVVTVGKILINH